MNIVTCQKCGWNYEHPMHTILPPNCPRCFPSNTYISTTTTTGTVTIDQQKEVKHNKNDAN